MKLEDVREVRECYRDFEVNDAIRDGFSLVKILSTRTGPEEVRPVYIMMRGAK